MNLVGFNTASIAASTFCENPDITSVDLRNYPFKSNSMTAAFRNCFNLTSVTNINQNVIQMHQAFRNCHNLNTVPVLPNSVTNISYAFQNCYNLPNYPTIPNSVASIRTAFQYVNKPTTPPAIPNSVTDMGTAFAQNFKLATLPTIPNSVTNCARAFYACNGIGSQAHYNIPENVTNVESMFYTSTVKGNIYIYSTEIINAVNFASGTRTRKINVYMDFTYANGINTNTYNAFTADGYPRDYVNLYNTSSTQTPLYYCYRASLGGIYLYYYTQNEYTTIPDGVTVYWKDTGSNQATSSSELNGNFVASGLTAPTRYSSGDLYT